MYCKHNVWVDAWTWFGRSTTAAANAVVDDDQRGLFLFWLELSVAQWLIELASCDKCNLIRSRSSFIHKNGHWSDNHKNWLLGFLCCHHSIVSLQWETSLRGWNVSAQEDDKREVFNYDNDWFVCECISVQTFNSILSFVFVIDVM